jgi:hypothetical protein
MILTIIRMLWNFLTLIWNLNYKLWILSLIINQLIIIFNVYMWLSTSSVEIIGILDGYSWIINSTHI